MSYSEMGEVWSQYVRVRCERAVEVLRRREFDARFFPTREEVVEAVLEAIPQGQSVGCGGSWTMRQLGVLDALRERGHPVYAHEGGMSFEETMRVRREALACPFYLSSANAVTMRGEIVNVDGIGNRVAGISFGPSTVIIVAGYNKLVPDLEAAFQRIREVAAPANAIRYNLDTPCVRRGQCTDCNRPASICRVTTIVSRRPMMTDFKVFLVGESLGF
ncbi:lactate utilization protein [Candidatus Solincola tengchongensis]|uniref:lactate utilization protein n=1 Tax=Candidatus Solincola tengchongensis TaxID=2900693 RepID=UPI00257E84A5|nr:lactate utilization protein [Candidatus Solincola tengchongensis]